MAIGTDPNDVYHNGFFYNRNGNQVTGVSDITVQSAVAVMSNNQVIFTASGDVTVHDLISKCITANGASATTLQYKIVPTVGSSTTISGVSSSLANAIAGTLSTFVGDALATAPIISTSGVGLSQTSRGIFFPAGTLQLAIGTGPTTGTWVHYIRYSPVTAGATVS